METLTIQTKLDDPYMPRYGTDKSVGLDFCVQEDVVIPPRTRVLVDLGFNVQFPEGVWGMLALRSSLGKRQLIIPNSVGIIDTDYCGPDDTLKIQLYNVSDTTEQILNAGERVCQLILMPVVKPLFLKVDFLDTSAVGENRGGFGSTGQ